MTTLSTYYARMTPSRVWPAAHSPEEATAQLAHLVDQTSLILRWSSNNQCPMNDMLAAWVVLGHIGRDQADATCVARDRETAEFLAGYRANPPQPDAEQLHEMANAFGPGSTVVNVITGQQWVV